MTETLWGHLQVAGAVLIPLAIAWWVQRQENIKMHRENQDRLIAIETKIAPVWDWWNRYSSYRSSQGEQK